MPLSALCFVTAEEKGSSYNGIDNTRISIMIMM